MLASFTLGASPRFPEGATVGVYLRRLVETSVGTGSSPGAVPVATAIVQGGVATFAGLEFETAYAAAANVSGVWRYVMFTTEPEDLTPGFVETPQDWFEQQIFRHGLVVSDDEMTMPGSDDVAFGALPYSRTDQHQVTKPGYHFDSLLGRSRFAGAAEIGEIEDPGELIFLRQPGQYPWGPVGATSLLAADVAAGANQFYLTSRRGFPVAAPAGVIPFKVGAQTIGYTGNGAQRATLCGPHPVGSTSLLYANAQSNMPSAGLGPIGTEMVEWSGKATFLSAVVATLARAGDTTLELDTVAGLPVSGVVEASAVGTPLNVSYSGIVGTTLQNCSGVLRNIPAGAAVVVYELTGVKHVDYVDLPVVRAAAIGDSELRLLNKAPFYDAWWAVLPEAGSARVAAWHSTAVMTVTWTGKDNDTGELLGVEGITAVVPYGSALTFVDRDRAAATEVLHGNLAVLEVGLYTGATGFVAGAAKGEFGEFSPRSKGPTPKNTTTGVIHFDPWAAEGGQQSRTGQVYNRTMEDVIGPKFYGGRTTVNVTTLGPNSFRRDLILWADHGSGVWGARFSDPAQFIYPWMVNGPGCRAGVQLMGAVVTVIESTRGWPAAGRFVMSVYNRQTAVMEDREFGYTGLGADNITFTGVTYDGADGFVIGDFFSDGNARMRLANRFKHKVITADGQITAGLTRDCETTIGLTGPTVAAPEGGIEVGLTGKVNLYRKQPDVWQSDDQFYAAGGLTTKVKAGAPTDADVVLVQDGAVVVDSTNSRLYVRSGGAWKYAALT